MASLPTLPTEIFALITDSLSVNSLRTLRLTCRVVSDKVCHTKQFGSFVKHQHRLLSEEGLQQLQALGNHPILSSHVTELTLVVPVYDGEKLRQFLEQKSAQSSPDALSEWEGPLVHGEQMRRMIDVSAKAVIIKYSPETLAGMFGDDFEEFNNADPTSLREDIEWMASQNFMHGSQAHIEMLTEIICSLHNLNSVTVDVDTLRSRSWRFESLGIKREKEARSDPLIGGSVENRFWNRLNQAGLVYAARGCRTAFAALNASMPKLENLQVLPTWRNSLALPALADALSLATEPFGFGARLETFSLRFCDDIRSQLRVFVDRKGDYGRVTAPTQPDDGYFASLGVSGWEQEISSADTAGDDLASSMITAPARLIRQFSDLRQLAITHCRPMHEVPDLSGDVFVEIASTVRLPQLKSCTLKNMQATSSSVLQFLKAHSHLEELEFTEVRLTDTSRWQALFDHLCTMPKLQKLSLSCIGDSQGWMHLAQSGDGPEVFMDTDCSIPMSWGSLRHTRVFDQRQLRQGLHFRPTPDGYTLGSPQSNNLMRRHMREFC